MKKILIGIGILLVLFILDTTLKSTPETAQVPATQTPASSVLLNDFIPEVVVISSDCFGSAGALVRFDLEWIFGPTALPAVGTLTYEIHGLDGGEVNTASIEIHAHTYQVRNHFVGIPTCNPDNIVIVPVRFRPSNSA